MDSIERGRVPSPRTIVSKEVPLVDRAEEMNALKEAVYRAVHGQGGLVFIHGEAGIGKTRLVRELGAYAQSRGVKVLYGRCPALFRMDGVPPYILWKEVIKDYLETCIPEQLHRVIGYYPAEVARLVPELSQKLGTIPQSFPISPEQEQNRLFEAVSQFITNISQETPLLVVLDDLQWTDSSSLLLLHYLARGVQKTPLLLVGAYRGTDIDSKHPLTPVLAELKRERLPQSVSLKRMSLDDISEMIRQILEQDDVPPEFCKMVYEKTRGNPFFTEEVIESLKEEEIIYREEDKWKFKDISKIEFPESVKNVVKARFNRLDEECRNVLTLASFVGNDFTLEAISALTGIEENKVLDLIEKLLQTGLIRHRAVRGEDVCSFSDIIVRDIVYEEVSPFRGKKLHNAVGCALEKVYAKRIEEHYGELALHFLESGDKEKALDYFLKAGEKATKIYANSETTSYFQSALRLLEEKEGELSQKARILESLGEVKGFVGDFEAAMKYWDKALSFYDELGEKGKIARLYRKMAMILYEKGELGKLKEFVDKALKTLEAQPESSESSIAYSYMSTGLWLSGDLTEALSWAEKARQLAEKLDDSEAIAWSYLCLGTISGSVGDSEKGIEFLEKALKVALENGHVVVALGAYNNLGVALPAEKNERSLEIFEKGAELARKAGHVPFLSWHSTALAYMNVGMGNMDKAILLAEESVALDRKTGNLIHLPISLGALGLIFRIFGEWDKSEQYLREKFDLSQKLGDIQSVAGGYASLGWLHFDKGEFTEAKEFFEKAYEVCKKAGAKPAQMYYSQCLARTFIELGEIEKASGFLHESYEFAAKDKNRATAAWNDAIRGILLRAQKRWEESITSFEKSIRELEALGERRWNIYWFARRLLFEYARAYLERNEEGDREKAHNLLNQALEIFKKIGAKPDIEKAEAKITFIETGKVISKPKSMDHVSTGHAALDELLYGGIPPNYAVVLTSPSCDERDLLVKSFLETGAKKGEVTFHVTIDASFAKALAEKSMPNMQLFVCNPEADAIIKDLPNVYKMKGVENITDISIALTSAIRKLDSSLRTPRRICIDLVSDVLLQHHAVETRRWLTALMTKLKSEGFTTLAVVDPRMHPSKELYAILGLFEGEINIREKETEKGLQKFFKIKRMSGQKYSENELPLGRENPE